MSSRSGSGSSSSPGLRRRRAARATCLLAAAWALAAVASPAAAKVFHTQEEALALAFPDADEVTSRVRVLTAEQSERIRALAGADLDTEIVKLYSGWKDGELLGYAYIDVHTVRTMPEAFMVVLDPDGRVRSLRVLAFYEPEDYLPADRWYQQFEGVTPGSPLRVGRDVHGILGATLSARAVAASVRRVQAFYAVLLAPPSLAAGAGARPPGSE